ncbi:hypothetical protein AB205_0145900, partial [Aquarana catesbeiana]
VEQIIRAFQCTLHRDTSRMSVVWKYFKINEDNPWIADCKLCSAKLSRGGTKISSYNTSNLIKHLKLKHKSEHGEFTAIGSSSSTQQPTLQQTFARREKLLRDHPRAVQITEALTQFIILDDQPLSIVENMGFHRFPNVLEPKYDIPSRHYITDIILPKIHDMVKKHINIMLQKDIKAISFTTDIWNSSVSPLSLISLTAQWIDGKFSLHQIMLHATRFEGSHTGQAIANILEEMLQTWAIPKSSVHVVVQDSAKNIIKRYKDRFFCNSDTSREAKEMLVLELQNIFEETIESEQHEEPASKRPHRDQPGTSLDRVFSEIAGEGSSISESSAPKAATIQLEAYLGEITVPPSENPLKYWAVHK